MALSLLLGSVSNSGRMELSALLPIGAGAINGLEQHMAFHQQTEAV